MKIFGRLIITSTTLVNFRRIEPKLFKIPEDLVPLEFHEVCLIDDHLDMEHIYMLYDDLDNYEDDDNVLIFKHFFVKINGELIETTKEITSYIREE